MKDLQELTAINGFVPLETQNEAYRSKAKYVLYGGSMGSGKSVWLVNCLIQICLSYPGAQCLLTRLTATSLERTSLITLMEWLPQGEVKKIRSRAGEVIFKNGSRLWWLGTGDSWKQIDKIRSMELCAFGIDEAHEIDENAFMMLVTRLRQNLKDAPHRGFLTSNPDPGWLKNRFVDEQDQRSKFRFFPASIYDNEHLSRDYINDLEDTLPDFLKRSWLDGDWSAITGENQVLDLDEIDFAMQRRDWQEGPTHYALDVGIGSSRSVLMELSGNKVKIIGSWRERDTDKFYKKVTKILEKKTQSQSLWMQLVQVF